MTRLMRFLEYLDRRAERKARRDPMFRWDTKTLIGLLFLVGYYGIVFIFMFYEVPDKNQEMVSDSLLVLGPGVGLILGAIFRTDATDVRATENTGKAFEAIKVAAQAGTGNGAGGPSPDVLLQPGETAQADPTPDRRD